MDFLKRVWNFINVNRILFSVIAIVLALAVIIGCIVIATNDDNDSVESSSVIISSEESSSEVPSSSEIVSETPSSSSEVPSSSVPVSSSKPVSSKPPQPPVVKPTINQNFTSNTNLNIEDNVFMDALVYTGYNIEKHRADGLMWVYILASQKRAKGWLSNIGYNGGSSGYETNAQGLPDIKALERGGLVCASFVTYVYFNYLPNVAGIDTSPLTKPVKSYSANDWYVAAKDWIKKGYSYEIPFTFSIQGSGIKFNPSAEIPIGSIIAFRNIGSKSDYCNHVVVYAGYKNGYHWVYHVGNDNGPEFCAVERMKFGPGAQEPLMVISTPTNIRMSAKLDVIVSDENEKPLKGAKFALKTANGKTIDLGATDDKGTLTKEFLSYGDYTLVQTEVPSGYSCDVLEQKIKLTTKENSYNTVKVTNKKDKPVSSSSKKQAPSSSSKVKAPSSSSKVEASSSQPSVDNAESNQTPSTSETDTTE